MTNNSGMCHDYTDTVFTGIWDPFYITRQYVYLGLNIRGSLYFAPLLGPYIMQVSTNEKNVSYPWK